MKITRFGHSCVLVDTNLSGRKVALFDPGVWSQVPVELLDQLDEIYITHEHADHCDVEALLKLRAKFPNVHIISTPEVAAELNKHGVTASDLPTSSSRFFGSPHEENAPFGGKPPEQIGVHYLEMFSHPGDSVSFHETCPILALPMTGPWGTTRDALAKALELKPKFVLPIHDWFWQDEARAWTYRRMKEVLGEHGVEFVALNPGENYEINDSLVDSTTFAPKLSID